MANMNNGLFNGTRRINPKVRGITVDGGVPGASSGYRLRGATQAGYPSGGVWKPGDLVPDRAALLWANIAAGEPGTWQLASNNAARGVRPPDVTVVQSLWMGSSGGPFTTGGTTSASSNADTSTFAIGTQSYFVTTNGAGAQAKISGSFSSPLNLTSECLVVWIRQDNLSNDLSGYPRLYLGDTNLTNAYFWKLTSAPGQPWHLDGEWVRVTLPFGAAATVGSPSRSSLAAMTIQVFDNSSGTTTFHFGGIATMAEPAAFPNGVVSLTFDDGFISQVQTAAPLMDTYGYRGTAFLISQVAQAGGTGPYTGYMSVAQALALENENRWECGSHAYNPVIHNEGYVVAGDAAALADAAAAKAWMTAEGFKSPWLHAYPLGVFDAGTILNSAQLFGAARTISSLGSTPEETFPPAQLTRLRSVAVSTATSLASIEAYVTSAAANKEWLILTFHDIQASASGGLQFSTANFTSLLAFINAAGMAVLPVGDVLTQGISMTPVSALGDVVYGNAAGVPNRLAGNTTATKNFLTQTGTGSVSAAPAWGTIASADMPTGTTGAKGALQLDGTATDIATLGAQAAGASGLAADAKHVHPGRDYNLGLSGLLGETLPRSGQMNSPLSPATGTLFMTALFLPSGVTIGHLATGNSGTAASAPTHWWFGLYDNNLNQLAVTADQTNAAWAGNAYKSLAIATIASGASSTFTTTYTGLYYFGFMMAAGTVVNVMAVIQNSTSLIGQAPVLSGTSDTSQTTPPGFPHAATALTANSTLIYGAALT